MSRCELLLAVNINWITRLEKLSCYTNETQYYILRIYEIINNNLKM